MIYQNILAVSFIFEMWYDWWKQSLGMCTLYRPWGGGGGVLRKKKLTGCAAPVFDQIPLAKELLVENIPLAKVSFLIMSPFLQDFKEFQPKYSHFKSNFPKIDANLAPECKFLGVLVKNIPLAKDLERKIYPWR